MFSIDDRLRGIPVNREQVAALYQSINSPHLAIPGKHAGPAKAYIAGVRGPNGFAVFVYLHLPDSADCAVYSSGERNLTPDQYDNEESEALGFVESMGFMVDNMNFRGLPLPDQEDLLKTLPVFMKDPRMAVSATPATKAPDAKKSSGETLGRILSSF